MAWFGKSARQAAQEESELERVGSARLRKGVDVITAFRNKLIKRVRGVNDTTALEVREAARYLQEVVECARLYVQDSQRALGRLQGQGHDSLGELLGTQSKFLLDHARDMAERAVLQDERARQAATSAKSIADLAASIERLAGEARLLAVNARIESSRLGAQSAGFEVLASEMQRLSDEVASTNERVGELAGRLGHDLPWIAQHARDFRQAIDAFSATATVQLGNTERGVSELRIQVTSASQAGGAVMDGILRASRSALSHLQFQDVVAQELRQLDGVARQAQVEAFTLLGAEAEVLSDIPAAEYTTAGEGAEGPMVNVSGDVLLF